MHALILESPVYVIIEKVWKYVNRKVLNLVCKLWIKVSISMYKVSYLVVKFWIFCALFIPPRDSGIFVYEAHAKPRWREAAPVQTSEYTFWYPYLFFCKSCRKVVNVIISWFFFIHSSWAVIICFYIQRPYFNIFKFYITKFISVLVWSS